MLDLPLLEEDHQSDQEVNRLASREELCLTLEVDWTILLSREHEK